MKSLKLFAASLALVCGSAFAYPTTWTDTVDPVNTLVTVTHPYVFNFDITDGPNGFRPLIDTVNNYSVSINLYDDQDPWYAPLEIALVNMPGGIGNQVFFNLSGEEYGGVSVIGWLELNLSGLLTVNIQSLAGDFYFGDATLNASGNAVPLQSSSDVPEPGSLLLLGAAFAAVTLATRRRKQ